MIKKPVLALPPHVVTATQAHHNRRHFKGTAMKTAANGRMRELKQRVRTPLAMPTDLPPAATKDITGAMNAIVADVFALYLKTKNFHWHLSGPHFRDYH